MTTPHFAIIFDLDGVLINTVEAHFAAWTSVAAELGVPFTRSDNDYLRGVPRRDALAWLARNQAPLGEGRTNYLLNLKGQVYRKRIAELEQSIKVPGVELLLTGLRDRGIPLGLASASSHASMLLEITGLTKLIDVISDGNSEAKIKPHPDQLLWIAAALHVPPHLCVVIEDSNAGLRAAQSAMMRRLAIGDRHGLTDPNLNSLHSLSNISVDAFLAACGIDTSESPRSVGSNRL